MAGLAMVQMDSNTENQIQVLRENEMLTTQGLGICERVVGGKDAVGDCADIACHTIASILGVPTRKAKHVAVPYDKCRGFDPVRDCFEIQKFDKDGNELLQVCAIRYEYAVSCHPLLRTKTFAKPRPFVEDKPGCNIIVAVGTTS